MPGVTPRVNQWRLPSLRAYGEPMPEDHFGERIAATYEARWPELFEPAVIEPAVSFLADLAAQIAYSHHFWTADGQLETSSTPHRYVWPSELDLMARIAGMTLHERWADWTREPFTGDSRSHVSVWKI
jgi:hypothetical protein